MRNGIAVAILHCLIVLSLAGKYALDRERLPRVWVKCAPVDPNLPVRGRYVSLRLEVDSPAVQPWSHAKLAVQDRRLTARPSATGVQISPLGSQAAVLMEPVAYFIPERVQDPSRRKPGEELWVEVSVPPKGSPRPLRLGVRKDGVLTPLQ
jgi:uncharacterized membrane-anchored protein